MQQPLRFRLGFIASSDNHSARPGTGYKEVARTEFTETRFGNFLDTPVGEPRARPPFAQSERYQPESGDSPFAQFETERQASFFLNGGLAAVHANGRSRAAIWDALQRKEAYGTSGPRILLWFDLLNAPGGKPQPMGSEVALRDAPIFRARAVGSFEQKPGCPADALDALGSRTQRLCQGECYNPSDRRRPITRIEVVRIRPGADPDAARRIDDPWRVIPCPGDPLRMPGRVHRPGVRDVRSRRALLRARDRGAEPRSRRESARLHLRRTGPLHEAEPVLRPPERGRVPRGDRGARVVVADLRGPRPRIRLAIVGWLASGNGSRDLVHGGQNPPSEMS